MGHGSVGMVVADVERLLDGGAATGLTEWQLLRRYLERRDEAAFAALVARHGPMVLGVCRRTLGAGRDIDDAFQATFVVLARKGGTLRERDPMAHWLYGVARRVALRARTARDRRATHERAAPLRDASGAASTPAPDIRELTDVVDEEVGRLPAKLRAAVVLCYLEGLTHDQAAHQLGWPVGSVKGRLSRARDLLRGRLERRGFAPGGAGILLGGVPLVVPPDLLTSTTRAALAASAGGVIPSTVAALAAGSLSTMILGKFKLIGAAVLLVGTGAAALAVQATQGEGKTAQPTAKPPVFSAKPSVPQSEPERIGVRGIPSEVPDWEAGWAALLATPADDSPRTKAIQKKLDERIPMLFPNETPFEDVKKYIEGATMDDEVGLSKGIPIYINPQGLMDTDKTMVSRVTINLDGIPLRTTLKLILSQLGMTFHVRDGLLTIDSDQSESGSAPIMILRGRADRGELSRTQYLQLIELLKLRKQVEELSAPPVPPVDAAPRGKQ